MKLPEIEKHFREEGLYILLKISIKYVISGIYALYKKQTRDTTNILLKIVSAQV